MNTPETAGRDVHAYALVGSDDQGAGRIAGY
jgi:hypothetical protein